MATYSVLGDEAVEELGRLFGVTFTEVAPLPGGMTNSSFTGRVGSDRVVITVLDNHDRQSAASLAALMDHLGDHGLRTPRLRRTRDGRAVAEIQGKPVIVKDFVDGRHESPLALARLAEVGGVLAQVHRIDPPSGLPRGGRRLPADWRSHLGPAPPGALVALLDRAVAGQGAWVDLPAGLVHGDLFGDNVLVTPSGSIVVLDWETATVEPLVLDLGMTTVGLCRTGNRVDHRRLDALLEGYEGNRRLDPAERDAVPAAIGYANAVLAFHRFVRHHITHPDPAQKDLYRELVDFGGSLA